MVSGFASVLVTPCLPQRHHTLAGCLCPLYWSERGRVNVSDRWPGVPRDTLRQGVSEGWLLVGNCSNAGNMPGVWMGVM